MSAIGNFAKIAAVALLAAASIKGLTGLAAAKDAAPAANGKWTKPVVPESAALSSTGRNPYFILEPGYQLLLKTKDAVDSLTITVLNETKTVDGVETRVVEERETKHGKLAEVSRNYFAIAKANNDLFYFGEDVDTYTDGKVTGHGGGWLAGTAGAKAGLMLPGKPAVGMRFYQEQAPKVAEDRSEIVALDVDATTPAGKFTKCMRVVDSSALENEEADPKVYAPGVGLLTDEDFELVKFGQVEAAK